MLLTTEQQGALDSFTSTSNNVCVKAVPGAGKSTLILEICKSLVSHNNGKKILIVSYNTELASNMVKCLEENNLNENVMCYTFHSLCSNCIQLAPDDISFGVALNYCKMGYIEPSMINVDYVMVDEGQDMKDIYIDLLNTVLTGSPKYYICGDVNQMIYDFDPDSMANTDILLNPSKYFKNEEEWSFHYCNITHRFPFTISKFVNTIFDSNIISSKSNGNAIDVVAPSVWKLGETLLKYITEDLNNTLILTPTKNGNRPLKALLNFLSSKNIPIHINTNSEKGDEKLKLGKLNVLTFHSSKGIEAKNVIVIVPDEIKENPLYVALTRSKEKLIVVLDPNKPNYEVCLSCRKNSSIVNMSPEASMLVEKCTITEQTKQTKTRKKPPMRSLERVRPKLSFYENFSVKLEQKLDSNDEDINFLVKTEKNTFENTSKVYAQAVMLFIEFSRTKKIRFIEDLLNPTRIEYEHQSNAIKMGMMNRFVYPRVPSSSLLPEDLYNKAEVSYKSSKNAKDFCTMALATLAWDDLHHVMRQLLPVESWVDELYFEKCCENALNIVPDEPNSLYDVRLKHYNEEQVMHIRSHIYNDKNVVHLIWSKETTQYDKGDAALRAAMHPKKTCKLINLLSNEVDIVTVNNTENILENL